MEKRHFSASTRILESVYVEGKHQGYRIAFWIAKTVYWLKNNDFFPCKSNIVVNPMQHAHIKLMRGSGNFNSRGVFFLVNVFHQRISEGRTHLPRDAIEPVPIVSRGRSVLVFQMTWGPDILKCMIRTNIMLM